MSKIRITSIFGFFVVLTLIVYIALAALREETVGTDTQNYIRHFYDLRDNFISSRSLEPGFELVNFFLSAQPSHEIYLLFWTAAICLLVFNGRFSGRGGHFSIFVLIWLSYPFFYSITLNVVRQGVAYGILFSFLLVRQRGWLYSLFFILLAASMHYGALFFGVLIIVARQLEFKAAIFFWLIGLVLGVTSIANFLYNILAFLPFDFEYYSSYFSDSSEYRSGFKIDFFLYSMIGVFLSLYFCYIKKNYVDDKLIGDMTLKSLAKVFFVFNGFALVFIQLPYADRYMSWSWYLYPLFGYFYLIRYGVRVLPFLMPLLLLASWMQMYLNLSNFTLTGIFRDIF